MSGSGAASVEVSIVIPAWRLPESLDRCLTALHHQVGAPAFETIVVVNGGASPVVDAATRHPLGPVVVPLAGNIGFGGACNIGAARARGEYVVFLNDDAEPEPGWLAALVKTAREREAQLVASVLLDDADRVGEAGARVLSTSETEPLGAGATVADAEAAGLLRTRPIDYGSGAGLLVSTRLFASLEGFDPAYAPAYYEDVDLQWRAREKGFDVWLAGDARIRHLSGQSTQDHQLFRQFASLHGRDVFMRRWSSVLAEAPARDTPLTGPAPIPLRHRKPTSRPPASDDPATVLAAAAAVQTAFASWLETMVHAANAAAIASDAQRDAIAAERDAIAVERDALRAQLGHTVEVEQVPEPLPGPLESLVARLQAVAQHIVPRSLAAHGAPPAGDALADYASVLLSVLVDAVRGRVDATSCTDDDARRWLLTVAVLGRFPGEMEFDRLSRSLQHGPPDLAATSLLRAALDDPGQAGRARLRIVTDRVIVEVDYSARNDHHTGIQRVVRETLPIWAAQHDPLLVAWSESGHGLRRLTAAETDRVLRYGTRADVTSAAPATEDVELVVPYGARILFPDVPIARNADVVRCLARHARNRLGHIGYDLIPLTSADLRLAYESVNTAQLFSVIKLSERVAGISVSATSEFSGLAATLSAQGLPSPTVAEVTLPAIANPLPPGPDAGRVTDRPVVLIVGTRELHKNQRAVLQAAELLWREGLNFEVRQVGGPGSDDTTFSQAAAALTAAGRPLTILGRVSEQRLWDEQRAADVAVFVSLHEGYGLPVAEALSVGTPVITTRYGAQAEVAADGGCLLVDPRDDADIANALRRVVTDSALRQELAAAAARRPLRTWASYAESLWAFLVEGGR